MDFFSLASLHLLFCVSRARQLVLKSSRFITCHLSRLPRLALEKDSRGEKTLKTTKGQEGKF